MSETWDVHEMLSREWVVVLLGYSAAVIAPIAVKFHSPLGGFLASASAYYMGCNAALTLRVGDSYSM